MTENQNNPPPSQRRRVAVVHHFFQHYRSGVLNALVRSDSLDAEFFGADEDVFGSGVEVWEPPSEASVTVTRCRQFGGKLIWQSGLLRLALRPDVDAVIFLGNPYYLATWISAALCRIRRKRVLFWTHGWLRPERGPKRLIRSVFYRLAHGLLVYGHTAKQLAIDNGFRSENVHVVFNSLDYAAQSEARVRQSGAARRQLRSELFDAPERPIVIFSSRLQERRRLDWLIAAAAELKEDGHPINLLVIGDGPERENLERMSESSEVPTRFVGACYDLDLLASFYAISTVTVSPGVVGLTAMQSLGFGVPVITHDSVFDQAPEAEAVLPGRTGALFRFGDVDDLARTVKEWTTQPEVDELIRRECIAIIEEVFNPANQLRIIEQAVRGGSGDASSAIRH